MVVVGVFATVLLLICDALWTTTASIIVAGVVSAVFAPIVIRLREQGRSRNAAAGVVWVAAIGIIAGLLLILVLALLPAAVEVVEAIQAGIDSAKAAWADLGLPPAVTTALQAAFTALRVRDGWRDRGHREQGRRDRDDPHHRDVPAVLLPARR